MTKAANLAPLLLPEPEPAEESAASTRLVAHLAFAQAEPQVDATTAAVAALVAEAEELDASTAESEATIAPIAEEEMPAPEPEVEPTERIVIPKDVRVYWEEWTALVESLARGKRRPAVKEAVYQQLYRSLVARLRESAAEATPEERYVQRRMEEIVAPWLSLDTFAQTDAHVLQSLWTRCRELEERLVPWRQSLGVVRWIAIAFLVLVAVGVGMQFAQVPALAIDTRWTWKGLWRWVTLNPMGSVGIVSPIVVALTALYVTRPRRLS
jgi:hypothetical protein